MRLWGDRDLKNTSSFRARIESHADASHLEKPILKKKRKKTTTFLQSSVFWTSESKYWDFLKMSVVERMVQPFGSPCGAEDLDNLRRKYIIFLTQDVWPNKWFFFYLQWNLCSRGLLCTKASVPSIETNRGVSWMDCLGWGLLIINQQMKHFSFIVPRNLLQSWSQAAR